MAKIKVFCIKQAEQLIVFYDAEQLIVFYDDEHNEIKQGIFYYVDKDRYEDSLTGVFVYEWDDIVKKFWELGLFSKKNLLTMKELRDYKINKLLEND